MHHCCQHEHQASRGAASAAQPNHTHTHTAAGSPEPPITTSALIDHPCCCLLPPRSLALPPLLVQAKQLVHSASSMSLQEVKDQLLLKPKIALDTAAQTLGNCQQNLQSLQTTLQTSLQQGLAEGRSTLEKHLSTLEKPGSPGSTANPLAALLSMQRVGSSGALQTAGGVDDATAAADGMLPWSLLAAPMRGREAAAIEALVIEDEHEGEGEEEPEASTSGRSWGPFQVRAEGKAGTDLSAICKSAICKPLSTLAGAVASAEGAVEAAAASNLYFDQACLCLVQAAAAAAIYTIPALAPHRPNCTCPPPASCSLSTWPACSGTRGVARPGKTRSQPAACGRMGGKC